MTVSRMVTLGVSVVYIPVNPAVIGSNTSLIAWFILGLILIPSIDLILLMLVVWTVSSAFASIKHHSCSMMFTTSMSYSTSRLIGTIEVGEHSMHLLKSLPLHLNHTICDSGDIILHDNAGNFLRWWICGCKGGGEVTGGQKRRRVLPCSCAREGELIFICSWNNSKNTFWKSISILMDDLNCLKRSLLGDEGGAFLVFFVCTTKAVFKIHPGAMSCVRIDEMISFGDGIT